MSFKQTTVKYKESQLCGSSPQTPWVRRSSPPQCPAAPLPAVHSPCSSGTVAVGKTLVSASKTNCKLNCTMYQLQTNKPKLNSIMLKERCGFLLETYSALQKHSTPLVFLFPLLLHYGLELKWIWILCYGPR